MGIPPGSARPGVGTPTGQHVGGLSRSPEVKSSVGIAGEGVTLGTNVQVHTIGSVGLRCKKNLSRSRLNNRMWVVIMTRYNMMRGLVIVNTRRSWLRISWL